MGWDKDSVTEQQREKKITTIILIKIIYRVQFSHCSMLSSLPSSKKPSSDQLPHLNMEHDITWYQTALFIGSFGSTHPTTCEN